MCSYLYTSSSQEILGVPQVPRMNTYPGTENSWWESQSSCSSSSAPGAVPVPLTVSFQCCWVEMAPPHLAVNPSPAEAQPTATPQSTELLSKPHVPNIHLTQSYISAVPELFFSQTDQRCYKSPQDAEARQDVTFMCSAFCLP